MNLGHAYKSIWVINSPSINLSKNIETDKNENIPKLKSSSLSWNPNTQVCSGTKISQLKYLKRGNFYLSLPYQSQERMAKIGSELPSGVKFNLNKKHVSFNISYQ